MYKYAYVSKTFARAVGAALRGLTGFGIMSLNARICADNHAYDVSTPGLTPCSIPVADQKRLKTTNSDFLRVSTDYFQFSMLLRLLLLHAAFQIMYLAVDGKLESS